MQNIKDFFTTFLKAIILIASIVFIVYAYMKIADFVGLKFGIDLYAPAILLGSIAILILAGVVIYHRVMSLIKN